LLRAMPDQNSAPDGEEEAKETGIREQGSERLL
jgi:hypothetical protein